jgi:hypothetical protein
MPRNYSIAQCRLDNKKISFYHAACPVGERPYDPRLFDHIGDGVIYSADGIRQVGINRYSFFIGKRKLKKYNGKRKR